jgi:hypothetical protein
VLRGRRFRTSIEGLANLAHEVEAEERRREPNRRALLFRDCEQAAHQNFRQRRDWPNRFAGRPLLRLRTVRDVDEWLTKLEAQLQNRS